VIERYLVLDNGGVDVDLTHVVHNDGNFLVFAIVEDMA
jgi:hypothetical protein